MLYTTTEPCPFCIGALYMSGARGLRCASRDAWAGSVDLLGATPYMRRKAISVCGPESLELEEVVVALRTANHLRRDADRAQPLLDPRNLPCGCGRWRGAVPERRPGTAGGGGGTRGGRGGRDRRTGSGVRACGNGVTVAGALACRDALVATTEFMNAAQILARYGADGVRDLAGGGWLHLRPGATTDDTAVALCVAEGIVEAVGERFVRWHDFPPTGRRGHGCPRHPRIVPSADKTEHAGPPSPPQPVPRGPPAGPAATRAARAPSRTARPSPGAAG